MHCHFSTVSIIRQSATKSLHAMGKLFKKNISNQLLTNLLEILISKLNN